MDYKDKLVLITGGTSGIGLALSRQLAEQGAQLFIFARSPEGLEKTIDELQRINPGEHYGIPTDVSDPQQVSQSIQQVEKMAGTPDLLINCAGVAHPGYVQDLDLDIFRWMMDVNYFGTVHVTKAVLPAMIKRKSGCIVNIGSLTAFVGVFGYTAYGASKFALRGFSDALRMEMKPHGIHVLIVYPADTDTPQLTYENQFKPQELKELFKIFPFLDLLPPEEVAKTIIRGIDKRQSVIFSDFGTKLAFKLNNILGRGIYPFGDWLIKIAKKNIQSQNDR